MKRGFTLVELSIVLVIIGLLIGGILVAQSMISTTKIQSFVREIQQYEISITNFRTNYKQYPGDSGFFSPPGAPDGRLWWGDTNGDGVYNAAGCNGALSNNEVYQVWAHLSQANMIKGSYPAYSPDTCGGPHNDDLYQTGRYTPYMVVNEEIETLVNGYGGNKIPFQFQKGEGENLFTAIYATPEDTMALTSKMGISVNDGLNKQVGLVTASYAINNCGDAIWNEVKCSDSAAVFGNMLYYFTP